MTELPPLIEAKADLDGVSIVLKSPRDKTPRIAWLLMLGVVALVAAVGVYDARSLPVAGGVALVALVFIGVGVQSSGVAEPEDVVLEVRRGRLIVDDRELATWDVEKAWWDCDGDVSTLVLERVDASERVVTVRRQTQAREGVTRRQCDWIADLITRGVEPATAAEIPDGLSTLRRRPASERS